MKKDIHPNNNKIKVICSCGNTFPTLSTYDKSELHIEVCSACHPFYTGKQKIVASDRVQRFRDRYQKGGIKIGGDAAGSDAAPAA